MERFDPVKTALLLVDMQNDFLHPKGAYARGGAYLPDADLLIANLAGVAAAMRNAGGWIISTHFTLVPGRGGEPMISAHLKKLRPFLGRGDFLPGSWGHALVEEVAPSNIAVEKVSYSAFYMSRLEFVLRKAGIERLAVGGIVTNGGVASTVRDAHVRDIPVSVIRDGCGAFTRAAHESSLASLGTIAPLVASSELEAALTRG